MTRQCCVGGAASGRLVRRFSAAAASILPAAALVLLPKCPLCVAAWLMAATGIGFSAAGTPFLRWLVVMLCVVALAAAPMFLRRAHRPSRSRS